MFAVKVVVQPLKHTQFHSSTISSADGYPAPLSKFRAVVTSFKTVAGLLVYRCQSKTSSGTLLAEIKLIKFCVHVGLRFDMTPPTVFADGSASLIPNAPYW